MLVPGEGSSAGAEPGSPMDLRAGAGAVESLAVAGSPAREVCRSGICALGADVLGLQVAGEVSSPEQIVVPSGARLFLENCIVRVV